MDSLFEVNVKSIRIKGDTLITLHLSKQQAYFESQIFGNQIHIQIRC